MQRASQFLQQFRRDTQGSVFVMVAAAIMAVTGAVGVAVDAGRAQMAQNKLQNALDAAGLAAGASINSADLETVVRKYLEVNFAGGNLGATITDVDPQLSEDGHVLTVSATATLPTTVMRIFGRDEVTLGAQTEITRTNKGMELALVLDTTGSMAGSKLTALKNAANDLLDILYGEETEGENLWVGVVPFSQAVNVGNTHVDWLDASHFSTLNWGSTSWAGCVESRWQHGNDVTDATPFPGTLPGSEKFKAYYWADHNSYNNWITNVTNSTTQNTSLCGPTSSNSCRCTTQNGGTRNCSCSTTTSGNTSTQTCVTCSGSGSNKRCNQAVTTTVTSTGYVIDNEHGPNKYCPSTVTRLTGTKAAAVAGINALVARGNTHVSEGAAWGYRLLSPNWRGLWGGSMNTNELPLNYNTPLMVKAAVIMTDGENTISNSVDGSYDYLSDNRLGTTNSGTAVTRLNTKLTTVCNAMKAQGIIVYTVVFDLNSSSVATIMRNCASSPDYYFDSPDEATLQQAFRTIGDSLANLRISH
jgi:Flp pilus assembly protein TadG